MDIQNRAILLDENEVACLMQASSIEKANHLGIESLAGFSTPHLLEARKKLQEAGLINQDKQIANEYEALFDALFHPERLLLAVRDLPGQGRQAMTFLSHQGVFILHTMLDEKTHRLELMAQPEQVAEVLKVLFPMGNFPTGPRFSISADFLERLFLLMDSGEQVAARKSLESLQVPPDEMDLLLMAVQNRKISGSLAILNLEAGVQPQEGFSVAVLVGDQSAWLFHQPAMEGDMLVAQRNGDLFFNILDAFSQRLADGTMFDEPLDNNKIVSFSLSVDEFAFCFSCINRNDLVLSIMEQALSGLADIQPELEKRMLAASDRLAARGWSKLGKNATPLLASKLASAISAIVSYGFVLQVNIIRPDLVANATVHVLPDQSFTSVLRPGPELYFLEHGHHSTLPVYLSKLFPDFGQTEPARHIGNERIAYSSLAEAADQNDSALSTNILEQAGLKVETARLLGQDMTEAVYRGSFIRINADSHASQDVIDGSVKPLLYLIKSQQRSWLYSFNPLEDKGNLILVTSRDAFSQQLSEFTA